MAQHNNFGRGRGLTAKNPQPPNDLVMTPVNIAKQTINLYKIDSGSTILDPCKGEGAFYSSGSRPNQTPQSWAYARVYSYLLGGPARKVDSDITKKYNVNFKSMKK